MCVYTDVIPSSAPLRGPRSKDASGDISIPSAETLVSNAIPNKRTRAP